MRHQALSTLLSLALLTAARGALPPPPESLCGPDIATLGDGWENAQLELFEMNRFLQGGPLLRWPQRMAALVSHLRLMERRALPDPPPGLERVRLGLRIVAERQMVTNRLALAGEVEPLRGELEQIRSAVQLIGRQFSPGALAPTTSLSHLLPPAAPTLTLQAVGAPELKAGVPVRIAFRLVAPDGKPADPADLFITHEARLHGYLIEDALHDFHHVAPEPAGGPGEYAFTFTPAQAGSYRLWVQVMPVATQREEFPMLLVGSPVGESSTSPTGPNSLTFDAKAFQAALRFEGEAPRVGEIASGKIVLTGPNREPITRLEPIFGKFAQITAFPAEQSSILHVHAAGIPPRADSRGGPEIRFRLRPTTAGFHRLFAEVRFEGKVHILRFDFSAASANPIP